jgi:phosphohistidine phosphatase
MNLFIMRHGVAAEPGTAGIKHDAERPLTREGEEKTRGSVKGMQALGLTFDAILSSPYLRARQTAELLAKGLSLERKLEFTEQLQPEGNAKKLVDLLRHRRSTENVLLVGHEPNLSQLISILVSGETGFDVIMKKGALCKLNVASLRAGRCAALEWLLTSKQMNLMG